MDYLDYLMPAGLVLDEDARRQAAAQAAYPKPAQQFVSPEQAQQQAQQAGAGQGASEAELAELKRRMAMAEAARGKHHTTALGGMFGAIGDTLNAYAESKLAKEYAAKAPGSMPAQAEQIGLQEKQAELQEGLMKLAQAKRRSEAAADINSPSNQFRANVIKQLGMEQLPEGLNPSDVQEQDLNVLARARGQDKLKIFKAGNGETVAFDPISGETETVRDAPPPRVGGSRGSGKLPNEDKLSKDFDARMSASGARAGAIGEDYKRLQNAQNLKTILQQPVNTPQMVAEATAALGRLITGGVVHEGTMEKMMPQTAGMALNQRLQYIFGHPRDAGVGEFLQYMGHTADREAANATMRIHQERLNRLSAHGAYFKTNAEQMRRQAAGYGISPEELDAAFSGAPTVRQSETGEAQAGAPKGSKAVVKKQRNKATGKIRVLYSDGTTEELNGQ